MSAIEPVLFRLDLPDPTIARLSALLSPDELARAGSFRHDLHRRRFVARRGQLRRRLAGLTGCPPAAIRFAYGNHGKPFLRDHPHLHFSTSSAEAVGLCVVGRGGPVGCDIAADEAVPQQAEIAHLLFDGDEAATLRGASGDNERRTFLEIWTRKEAYLKAIGTGFAQAAGPSAADGGWRFAMPPLDGFRCAIAFRAPASCRSDPPGSFDPDG